jgi:hypothetical protein
MSPDDDDDDDDDSATTVFPVFIFSVNLFGRITCRVPNWF